MLNKTLSLRIAILLLGLLFIFIVGRAINVLIKEVNQFDIEIKMIRQLAASGDPGLSEALDRSMIYIPAGEFLMGSDSGRDNEQPPRLVYLDAFEIDRFEVVNEQYQRFNVQ